MKYLDDIFIEAGLTIKDKLTLTEQIGIGDRMLVVNALGVVSNQAIPTGNPGTVTSVSAGNGMSFTEITSSGSVAIDANTVPYIATGFSTGRLYWNGLAWVFDDATYLTGAVTSVTAGTGMSFSAITSIGAVDIDTTKVPYLSGGFSAGKLYYSGSVWSFDSTSYVAGTGTINYVPKFTAAGVIGNSSIFDSGTAVGVFTALGAYKFTVNGHVGIINGGMDVNYGSGNYLFNVRTPSGPWTFVVDPATNSVGVGTRNPVAKLHVDSSSSAITAIYGFCANNQFPAQFTVNGASAAMVVLNNSSGVSLFGQLAGGDFAIINSASSLGQQVWKVYRDVGNMTALGFGHFGTNPNNAPTNPSAILCANSTTKGFLPPRLTTSERDLVASPATGLIIYNTTVGGIDYYNGSSWLTVGERNIAYTTKTANYTLLTSDSLVKCTTNSFAITLPTAVGVTGKIYHIKVIGSISITINTTSSQTIDTAASGTIVLGGGDNMTVFSDGANWIIL